MKKFALVIGASVREVNANEYSVSPKTGSFDCEVLGEASTAWTTSGKGKSAINNHYIYFREGSTLFYVKSDASEVLEARKGLRVEASGYELPEADPMDGVGGEPPEDALTIEEADAIMDAPAPKRRRSRK